MSDEPIERQVFFSPEHKRRVLLNQKRADGLAKAWNRDDFGLLQDLAGVGLGGIESVWDLFSKKRPWDAEEELPSYEAALPILVEHLGKQHWCLSQCKGIAIAVAKCPLTEEFARRTALAVRKLLIWLASNRGAIVSDHVDRASHLVGEDHQYTEEQIRNIAENRFSSTVECVIEVLDRVGVSDELLQCVDLALDDCLDIGARKQLAKCLLKAGINRHSAIQADHLAQLKKLARSDNRA